MAVSEHGTERHARQHQQQLGSVIRWGLISGFFMTMDNNVRCLGWLICVMLCLFLRVMLAVITAALYMIDAGAAAEGSLFLSVNEVVYAICYYTINMLLLYAITTCLLMKAAGRF